jgi:hypothetical protein
MRTTVIITKRGPGYISDVSGQFGGGHKGARCGLTPFEAAASAARLMIEYGQGNPEGADLMAPPEVLELVPTHLRSIKGVVGQATLRHDDVKGFILIDADGKFIAKVDVGSQEDEVDWEMVEDQASILGYELK